jgi:hypothetical protein
MKHLLLAFLMMTGPAMACSSDNDCLPGSQCLKAFGSMYGACAAGGVSLSNSTDRQSLYSPSDGNRTYANACSFDVDCSPGSHCFKVDSFEGLCMK